MKWIENGTMVKVTIDGAVTPCEKGDHCNGMVSPSTLKRPFVKNCVWVLSANAMEDIYTLFPIQGVNYKKAQRRALRVLAQMKEAAP